MISTGAANCPINNDQPSLLAHFKPKDSPRAVRPAAKNSPEGNFAVRFSIYFVILPSLGVVSAIFL